MKSNLNAYIKAVQGDYLAYCYHTNKNLDGGWKPTKFHRFLCEKIQEFIGKETGHPFDILLISTPPQFGKSITITKTLPSFYLGRNPKHRVIEISYNEDFAQEFGRENKRKIAEYGEIFGVSLNNSTKSNTEWELDNAVGGMISRGVKSGVTGKPCNLMIIDDPIKNQSDADSETYRRMLINEWRSSFKTRLAAGAKVIVIQTRWHEGDLYGFLKENEDFVTEINIPCEAEENDPLGRSVGEGLCPEIGKGTEWLKLFKPSFIRGEQGDEGGTRAWNALYQGRPVSAEGNLIKREWWERYDELPKLDTMIMSVDAAFKDDDTSDYVAIQVWGRVENRMYLVDAVKEHLNFPDTQRKILMMKLRYPSVSAILIEDKANGTGIIQTLRHEIMGIIPVTPHDSKVSRVNEVSFVIEAGLCYLPRTDFANDFIEECAAFPHGKHDDQVDCMSQALKRLMHTGIVKRRIEIKQDNNGWHLTRHKKKKFGMGADIHVI